MIEKLRTLTPDAARAERLRARCHEQLARQRHAAQEPPIQWGLEGTIVGGVCVVYLSAVMLTALQVLERMATTGRSLTDLASVMTRLPQVLLNVPNVDKSRADDDAVLAAAVAEEEAALGDTGRILLRPSGTEALVRVMVEAPTAREADEVAARLAAVVRRQLAI